MSSVGRIFVWIVMGLLAACAASCFADSVVGSAAGVPSGASQAVMLPVEFSQPLMTEVNGLQEINVAECERTLEMCSSPRLPYRTLTLKLPYEARDVRLELCDLQVEESELGGPLPLSGGPVPLSDPALFTPVRNPEFSESAWFPSSWARMRVSGGRDLDDWTFKKFVTVSVCPVRYLASELKLQSLSSGTIKVSYKLEDKKSGTEDSAEACDLLIIAPEEYAGMLNGFALHKNLLGLKTVLVTLEEAIANPNGSNDAAKLKHFISEHVREHGTRFVLGIGDANVFPVRYADVWDNFDDYSNITDGHVVPSDLYYADLYDENGEFCSWDANGNELYGESSSSEPNPDQVDLMPDVLFSRLSVSRQADLNVMISHIMNYELNVSANSPNFERVVLCGTRISGPDAEGEWACEQLASDVFADYEPVKLYLTSTFARSAALSDSSVLDSIGQGCGFATYVGHGAYSQWAFGMGNDLYADQVAELANADMLPFVSAAACETAGFDNENWEHPQYPSIGDCIGERFVSCANGGAIAYTGATRVAYGAGSGSSWNTFYAAKLSRLTLKAHKDGYRTVGEMFAKSVEGYVSDCWSPSVYDMKTVMEWATFGDPSVQIGGRIVTLLTPVKVQLSVPRFAYQNDAIGVRVSCANFGDRRDVLAAIVAVTPQGEMLSYPDWAPELTLVPFTLEAGLSIEGFELASFDTSLCPLGCSTFYIMLFDPETLAPRSNLGGSCLYIR